jgi:hypothetical protein
MIFDNVYEGFAHRELESNHAARSLAPELQQSRIAHFEGSSLFTSSLPCLQIVDSGRDITNDSPPSGSIAGIHAETSQIPAGSAPEAIARRPAAGADQTALRGDLTATSAATPHGEAGAVSLAEAKQRRLPEHIQQTDNGFGTAEHPINNNCQTSTLKNLFNFYGQSDKASNVNQMEEQLLESVQNKNGAGIDKSAFGKVAHDYEPSGSPDLVKALNNGQTDPAFVQDVRIKEDGKDVDGKVATVGLNTLMLTELGTNPEKVDFGKGSNEKVMNALKDGKPVLISDTDTASLRYMANGIDQKEPGHTYMLFQKDGKTYCSDPSSETLFEVSQDVLNKKLNDSSSYGIILNSPPDTDHFLKH